MRHEDRIRYARQARTERAIDAVLILCAIAVLAAVIADALAST